MHFRILMAILFSFIVSPTSGQENLDEWAAKISGVWKVDSAATSKLWKSTWKEEMAGDLSMMPIAAQAFVFKDGKLSFDHVPETFDFEVKGFDSATKTLEIEIAHSGRKSSLFLRMISANTLVLDLPATAVGPIEVAYSRLSDSPAERDSSAVSDLVGQWRFQKERSQQMWESTGYDLVDEKYAEDVLKNIEKFDLISIESDELEFLGDSTSEPFDIISHDKRSVVLRTTLGERNGIEINRISKDLIQIVDERRRLYAIFERVNALDNREDRKDHKYPRNDLAHSLFPVYVHRPRPPLSNRVEPLGIDGGVEIEEIDIRRRWASGAVVKADITNMRLQLFLDVPTSSRGNGRSFLVQFTRLDPIVDDTGKSLLTQRRRDRIAMLAVPVVTQTLLNKRDGRSGPSVQFELNAPAIGATGIKELAGELEVFQYSTRLIKFENIRQRIGKKLEHPLLNDLDIRPGFEDGRFPKFSLTVDQLAKHRILYWGLVQSNGERLPSNSIGHGSGKVSKGFRQPVPKGCSLWMEVVDRGPSLKYPFKFKGVKFP